MSHGIRLLMWKVKWSDKELECMQALRTSNYEQFKDRNPNRLEGTCQWVFGHENFRNWRESKSSGLLWISADPGCGKSVLSKSLVDKDLKSMDSRITCHFFFKDNNDKQKSITTALSALLHQLFSQQKSLIHHALPDYADDGKQLHQSFHKLWGILVKAASDPKAGEVICILDALDECEESDRYDIIKALNSLYRGVNTHKYDKLKLKFLVTSRPYHDIERRFAQLAHGIPTIRLRGEKESEAISHEINIVIKQRVSDLGAELDLYQSEQSALERELLNMTHRTYLWLHLILDVIRDQLGLTDKKLKQIISTLPSTVDQAYEAMLSKVKDRERAQKLLHIVVAATRPLTLSEMNIALAIEDYHQSYGDLDLENETRFQITLRNLCGLFVNVVDQKVYLIHQTAKEFLVANSEVRLSGWKHSLDPLESEIRLAGICITYLMLTDFDNVLVNDMSSHNSVTKQQPEEHGFLSYAACFWPTHYRQSQRRVTKDISKSVLEILDTRSKRFQTWFPLYWKLAHPYTSTLQSASSMMVASYFGHETVVELLLKMGKSDVNSKDRNGRTPLSWASENGHSTVVELLLETDKVNVDSADRSSRTPLSWAAGNGREAVVKLLFDTGKADVDVKERYGRTPLSWAAGNGHEAVVKLLLEMGKAHVNSKDRSGRTPLSWATENGHGAVVKLLLEVGRADVDLKDRSGRTPLSWAAENGQEAVIRLLLEIGKAEVDSKDDVNGRTPLSRAAENGNEAVVKLLLEIGKADVDSKDDVHGRTPLSWAAENGHSIVVKLLLRTSRADVESEDVNDRTPLSWAAENGHEAVVKLLLETGKADVNSEAMNGRTPLSWSAGNGHEAVVKLLLGTGMTDIDSQDVTGRTALSWAAEIKYEDKREAVVKLLHSFSPS